MRAPVRHLVVVVYCCSMLPGHEGGVVRVVVGMPDVILEAAKGLVGLRAQDLLAPKDEVAAQQNARPVERDHYGPSPYHPARQAARTLHQPNGREGIPDRLSLHRAHELLAELFDEITPHAAMEVVDRKRREERGLQWPPPRCLLVRHELEANGKVEEEGQIEEP